MSTGPSDIALARLVGIHMVDLFASKTHKTGFQLWSWRLGSGRNACTGLESTEEAAAREALKWYARLK